MTKTTSLTTLIPTSVYQDYAVFAERQYHAMVRSPDNLRWKLLLDRKKQEIDQYNERLRECGPSHREYKSIQRALERAKTEFSQDDKQYQAHNSVRYAFLDKAIEMHALSLEATDRYDDDACIRLCSLWFANFELEDVTFQDKLSMVLARIPSRKFVFLIHQLSARLSTPRASSSPDQSRSRNAYDLVLRMCRDHPFHCLYPVFCLKGDNPVTTRRVSGRHDPQTSQADRSAAAMEIFSKLQEAGEEDAVRCSAVERVCEAARNWAKFKLRKAGVKTMKSGSIPKDQDILRLRDIHVPVMTAYTPLDATTKYTNCVWIQRYEPVFSTAGGVNLPKIVVCLGSDGRKYKQLVSSCTLQIHESHSA